MDKHRYQSPVLWSGRSAPEVIIDEALNIDFTPIKMSNTDCNFMEDHEHASAAMLHALGIKPELVGKLVPSRWIDKAYESKQYRFPVSKKKRIRQKWAKDKRNYRDVEVKKILVNTATGAIYGHPDTIEFINKYIEYGRLSRR
ncbi:hypothetical protein [Pedobacter ginsengisoli]|uniref:hypothetical protein n=1 Tax=Pedobacter ginsengisoli TaxID=363852 RepID=UPI00254AB1DD|nr:hypothetical protein [Pedobacter ginsengisoli]